MKTINCPKDAYNAILPLITRPEQEEVFIICLNTRNGIKDISLVSLGTDTSALFPIKAIAKQAILNCATGVILAHTHPSGDSTPSQADIAETERLRNALNLFDISLMDHIILGGGEFYSFSDEAVVNV